MKTAWIAFAAMLGLSACSAAPLPEGSNELQLGTAGEFRLPVTSVLGRRFQAVIRQQYDFSCGSAALATLLTFHYGAPINEQGTFLGMWRDGDRARIRTAGFSLLDMKRYLAARGISSDGYKVTLEQIVMTKIPGIVLIRTQGYFHFVVVKGVADGQILVGDPSLGIRRIPERQFREIWNGVYFVINGGLKPAPHAFGADKDWDLAPAWRFTGNLEPVPLQALALMRPLPGDF